MTLFRQKQEAGGTTPQGAHQLEANPSLNLRFIAFRQFHFVLRHASTPFDFVNLYA